MIGAFKNPHSNRKDWTQHRIMRQNSLFLLYIVFENSNLKLGMMIRINDSSLRWKYWWT